MQSIDVGATLARAQAGDVAALAGLYNAYAAALRRYCYLYLGDQTTAEQCVQEVFVCVWQSVRTIKYHGDGPFTRWLYLLTKRMVVRYMRQAPQAAQLGTEPQLPEPQLGNRPRSIWAHHTLRDAIYLLPDKQRDVIVLKFFVGLSNLEIAGVVCCSEGAVKALQLSALAKLQRLLPDDRAPDAAR